MKKQKIIFKVIALTLSFAMSFSVFAVSFSANATTDWESKITDQLAGVIESASPDELIPVAIWYSDINYDEVNKEVENKTGLTAESIDTDLAMPSDELLSKLSALSDTEALSETEALSLEQEVKADMQSYLEKTKDKREYERELTDSFILSKRSIAKEKYIEKGNTIKNSLNIADEDIKFQSQYAPMINTEMTVSEIEATAKKAYVDEIYYEPDTEFEYETENRVITSNNVEQVRDEIGLTGDGVKVGIWETGSITITSNLSDSTIIELSSETEDTHKTGVAEIITGSTGIAPNVILYSSSNSIYFDCASLEELISNGVSVINASFGSNTPSYDSRDRWIDHIAVQHNVTLVKSAGNRRAEDGYITSPGKGYNVITAGAYYYDENESADKLTSFSSYVETGNDVPAKPDLVAYGPGGTSHAAPNVVGIIALMLELKPSLAAYPAAIKAILQSSCHRKVIAEGDTELSSGITDMQGAGAVDAYTAVCIVGNGQYITGTVDTTRSIVFEQPIYDGDKININLAWLIDSHYTESQDHTTDSPVIGDIHQLGMDVFLDGAYADSSDLSYIDETTNETVKRNSSTEMVTLSVTDTSSKLYNVRIYNGITTDEEIPFALAWSTNATPFNNNTSGDTLNGIYYVANKSTGDNLYPSSTSNTLISSTGINSWWILKKNANLTTYTLQTNSTSKPGYLAHGNSITNGYYSLVNQTTADNIYVVANSDGSFGLKQVISNTVYLLTYDETSDTVIWAASTGADTQKWYLNRINYYFGDVNYNGVIDSTDVTKLQNHIVGTTLLTRPAALYLADANQDGSINGQDVLAVRQYIAKYAE